MRRYVLVAGLTAVLLSLSQTGAAAGHGVTLKLLDAVTGEAVAGFDVEIHSDNGLRCIRAPCPIDSKTWRGKSDATGHVVIPADMIQVSTHAETPRHHGQVHAKGDRDAAGAHIVELFPKELDSAGPLGLGVRYFKLVDATNGKPIAHQPVKLQLGRAESLELETNSLGYIFIPGEKAMGAFETTYATVPGFRRKRLDYGGVSNRTAMERG